MREFLLRVKGYGLRVKWYYQVVRPGDQAHRCEILVSLLKTTIVQLNKLGKSTRYADVMERQRLQRDEKDYNEELIFLLPFCDKATQDAADVKLKEMRAL